MNTKIFKQATSSVIDSLLKNPYKKQYEKEYITLLEQIVGVRDTTKFFDEWMIDFFVEDMIKKSIPLIESYKTLSKEGKECAKYMLNHYVYWYYKTEQKEGGDALREYMKMKINVNYNSKNTEKQIHPVNIVNTEKIGKIFEMAICTLFNSKFNGEYKYSIEEAEKMSIRISKLKTFISSCEHIGKKDEYDFKTNNGYLSAKTTKSSDKICPQIIGQPSKKVFCKHFKLPETSTNDDIKKYIIKNTSSLLDEYIKNTFHCSLLYYDTLKDKVLYINKKKDIKWINSNLSFSRNLEDWNESSTLKYNDETIGEFQIHTGRSGIKFRWNLYKLLGLFKNNFDVLYL